MFKGLKTVIYHAPDIDVTKSWYTTVFGVKPYFDEPFYVGFDINGFELGLMPDSPSPSSPPSGAIVYWEVVSASDALSHLVANGATIRGNIEDVGGGIQVATVLDPFGNIFGIIEMPKTMSH